MTDQAGPPAPDPRERIAELRRYVGMYVEPRVAEIIDNHLTRLDRELTPAPPAGPEPEAPQAATYTRCASCGHAQAHFADCPRLAAVSPGAPPAARLAPTDAMIDAGMAALADIGLTDVERHEVETCVRAALAAQGST